jgi:hypothetical protein
MGSKRALSPEVSLDGGGPLLYQDPADPQKSILVRTDVCDNPECQYIHLDMMRVDAEREDLGLSEAHRTRLQASVDVENGEISDEVSGDADLLRRLEDLLRGPLLELVRRRWRSARPIGSEQWRARDWSWWEAGDLVSWTEVFPDDPQILFSMDDAEHWANDTYCVTPGCKCKDATLQISRIEQGDEARLHEIGLVHMDLGRWQPQWAEDGPRPAKPLEAVWSALSEDWPELRRELRHRAKAMRKLGPEIHRLSGAAPSTATPAAPKVGRNDPCPCGSGKKFKKCCGA